MGNGKDKGKTGAGTGAAPAGDPPKPRERAAISMERRLALLLASLVAFCDLNKVKGEPVEAGRKVAEEVTEKVIKPIKDRLTVLRTELKGYNFDTVAPAMIKDTINEIARLEARLKVINQQATGA